MAIHSGTMDCDAQLGTSIAVARQVAANKGYVDDETWAAALDAGWSDAHLLEGSQPMHLTPRSALLVLTLSLAAVACTADDGQLSSADGASSASPVTVEQIASTPEEDTLSALTNRFHADHPDPLIDPDEVTSGGPPPDGIPPIDGRDRRRRQQLEAGHLGHDEGDRILDFGTSGLLYNSALVMYDRQTETLWSHFTGEAAIGHLTGEVLDILPVSTVSWEDWREANPEGLVLSRDTGFDRSYGTNPYPGYDHVDSAPFLFDGEVDGRLAAKVRVLGIERAGDAAAVRLDTLREDGVRELDLGSEQLVAWLLDGTTSALDAGTVSDGRDVGATGVFSRIVDGQELTFERTDEGFVDEQTGTTWNVLGQAVSGPLAGTQLEAVPHVDTFWFAWSAFQPDTTVIG